MTQPPDQPHEAPTAATSVELARIRDMLHHLQEAQAYSSHDADGFGKQLIVLQQQVQALSRRLSTIEAKLVQQSLGSQDDSESE